MHVYFIGIGGTGVGPLALIASEAGYVVSGSDNKKSEYTKYLEKKNIPLWIDQSGDSLKSLHSKQPVDWIVAVSSIIRNNPDHPELVFARKHNIKITERNEFLNEVLSRNNLKMIAAAGTHGKTTTTAMLIWLFKSLNIPVSYSVGAKTTFADMGHFDPASEYFIYECDEFHRNFLSFYPELSIISGVSWDHHEVFPSRQDYIDAFNQFIKQSKSTVIWDNDAAYLGQSPSKNIQVEDSDLSIINDIRLYGLYNRRNAWLVISGMAKLLARDPSELISIMSKFPGSQRRMEELSEGLFSDYAHTPEKIIGCMSAAKELARDRKKSVVVIYEPLTNRRQHFMKNDYKDCFNGAKYVYWVPSYLAREDPNQNILSPEELIRNLADPSIAEPAELNNELWDKIQASLESSIVVCMSGGGGQSLDEWLRAKLKSKR